MINWKWQVTSPDQEIPIKADLYFNMLLLPYPYKGHMAKTGAAYGHNNRGQGNSLSWGVAVLNVFDLYQIKKQRN